MMKTRGQRYLLRVLLAGCVFACSSAAARSPELREFSEIQVSPNEAQVAYVIERSSEAPAALRDSLVVSNLLEPTRVPREVAAASEIRNVRWDPAGDRLYFVSASSPTAIQTVTPTGVRGREIDLGTDVSDVAAFSISPSGAFAAVVGAKALLRTATADGLPISVPASDMLSIQAFTTGGWLNYARALSGKTQAILLLDHGTLEGTMPLALPKGVEGMRLQGLQWGSPSTLRVSAADQSRWSGAREIVTLHIAASTVDSSSVAPGDLIVQGADDEGPANLAWRVTEHAMNRTLELRRPARMRDVVIHPTPDEVERAWISRGTLWLQVRDGRGGNLWGVNPRTGTTENTLAKSGTTLEHCDIREDTAVCVSQGITRPPELVAIDLRTGGQRIITHTNVGTDLADQIQWQRLQINNRFGRQSTGYLLMPRNAPLNLPVCIVLYNFVEAYSARAQWIHNYPVLDLVQHGVGVFLLNFASADLLSVDDPTLTPDERRTALLWSPLSTVDAAVAALRTTGRRPDHFGLMGWSWGGFVAAYASTRREPFEAISLGEPGAWGPAAYALSPVWFQQLLDLMVGGSPERALVHYRELMPWLGSRKAVVPTLVELSGSNPLALEYLTIFARNNPLVEGYLYPAEPHHFSNPERVALSYQRNLLWMTTYLTGVEPQPRDLRSLGLGDRLPEGRGR